jgi:hypothetical protein
MLSLKSSRMRKDAKLGDGSLLDVPPTRTTTIATSTAQNDGGVFNLDFRGELYMPFEGAGAVESTWEISLPKRFRPFDYSTINDVLLHISYTAEHDGLFRNEVEKENGKLETYLQTQSLDRLFSLRQEFSTAFHRLIHEPVGQEVPFELSERHFPIFMQGKPLEISKAALILGVAQGVGIGSDGSPSELGVEIQLQRKAREGVGGSSGTARSEFKEFDRDPAFGGLFTAAIDGTGAFADFDPTSPHQKFSIQVVNAGTLAPATRSPSDQSALDETKIKDVYLVLEYYMR